MKSYKVGENILLREGEQKDLEAVVRLIKDFATYLNYEGEVTISKRNLEQYLFNDSNNKLMVIENDDKIMGYCIYYYIYSTFTGKKAIYLEDLYISEKLRGKGIGKKVFAVLEEITKEEELSKIQWNCLNENKSSIEFYKNLGAKTLDEFTYFYI